VKAFGEGRAGNRGAVHGEEEARHGARRAREDAGETQGASVAAQTILTRSPLSNACPSEVSARYHCEAAGHSRERGK